jgi:hypothetical protein
MMLAKAKRLWANRTLPREGYLDAAARIEEERPLSRNEQNALDALMADFQRHLERVALAAKGKAFFDA